MLESECRMWPRASRYVKASFEGQKAWRFTAILCTLFLAVGVLVRYSFLQGFDLRFTRELQENTDPTLNGVMFAITFLGNASTLIGVAAVAGLAQWSVKRKRASALIWTSLAGLPIDLALKGLWDRARPDDTLVHVAVRYSGTSFPSGHAMGGTMVYGALAALAYMHLPKGMARAGATSTLVLMAFAIDVSRVYLGAHWFSDVVGGSAIGLALLIPLIKWYAEGNRR